MDWSKFSFLLLFCIIAIERVFFEAESCTAIGVTPGASKGNKAFIAHTDDAGGDPADVRLIPVSAKFKPTYVDKETRSIPLRPIYHVNSGFPRLVSYDRGNFYWPQRSIPQAEPHKSRSKSSFDVFETLEKDLAATHSEAKITGEEIMKPLAFISDNSPLETLKNNFHTVSNFELNLENTFELHETAERLSMLNNFSVFKSVGKKYFRYGYLDQDYGLTSEVGLSVGESTCGAKTVGWSSDLSYGFNLFGIAELSKIALERCVTSRCAVLLMGFLAEKFGFYSEDSGDPKNPGYGDSAEALVIGDRYGEIFVFHVLTGEKNSSAVFAAQKVPDGHITVVPNGFIIREIDFNDTKNFLVSKDIKNIAKRLNFWSEEDQQRNVFDFTRVFGFVDKTPITPLYVGRRIWRIFDIFAPNLKLNYSVGYQTLTQTYPFSVKVEEDKKIDTSDMINLLKDHFQDTIFDTAKGLKAGPFGNPNIFTVNKQKTALKGGFERAIAIFRTLFSFIVEIDVENKRCVVFYGQDKPYGTVYLPFLCNQQVIPKSYLSGTQSGFSIDSSWRAFNFLNNIAMLRFDAVSNFLLPFQSKLQTAALEIASKQRFQSMNSNREMAENELNQFADKTLAFWWKLAFEVAARFADGYEIRGENEGDQVALSYPDWWLQEVGFTKWPGDTYIPPTPSQKGDYFMKKLRAFEVIDV